MSQTASSSGAKDLRPERTGVPLGGVLCSQLIVGLGEITARAFLTSPSRQIADPEIGFQYIPGSILFQAQEGGAHIRLNSLGFNDGEVGPKGDRKRLVVVGDSMTEALQVDRPSNYVSRLAHLRPDIEFVNAARSDAGPLEYRTSLRRLDTVLDPDLVLFAFSFGELRDVRRGRFSLERDADGRISALSVRATPQQEMKRVVEPLIQRSALATHLMRRFGPLLDRWRGAALSDASPAALDDTGCAEVVAFILREAASHRPVAAMFLPQLDYLADRRSRVAPASAQEAAVLAHAAEQAGVPFLLLHEGLKRQYQDSGQPGHGFPNNRVGTGHLNPAGHMAVAHDVAGFLRPMLPRHLD